MYLKGIRGEMKLADVPLEMLQYLIAGELLHVGTNSSFGFGKYSVKG